MPGRAIPLVNEEFYHIFNRGIDHRPTFLNKRDFTRAVTSIYFYRFISPPIKLSQYLRLNSQEQNGILVQLEKNKALVEILCYCFMPNHFHFLLRQKKESGIAKFMSNFQNSYTRYFNIRQQRNGPLFLGQFKAIRIETEEQLFHLTRYIHLNPYSSYLVKNLGKLKEYLWSSFPEFLERKEGFCEKKLLLNQFKNKENFEKFILSHADYQRDLEKIKHLILENQRLFL